MSESLASKAITVPMNFLQAAVMTWAALNTEGLLRLALWVMVALYIAGVMCALMFLTGDRS